MELPFTSAQFMEIFRAYNQALWPAHLAAYALGLLAVGLCLGPRPWRSRLAAAILAVMWLVNGAAYHLAFFARINPAAWGFGGLFLLGGLLFLWAGAVQGRMRFKIQGGLAGWAGALCLAYGLILYPLLGRGWPFTPAFGLAPCPTTIFTWGLLLWTTERPPLYTLIAPLIWSLIGFLAALKLGIREDAFLLAAGLGGAFLVWRKGRPRTSS
ncbi:MAG: hypothetical protein C4525_01935 [Desulfarculus sp.]|nr:MAG: hypothetical protein C4525_01935 [Desulfarculus sp.]